MMTYCVECQEEMNPGEEYYDSYRGAVCRNCLEDMDIDELFELMCEHLSIAEDDGRRPINKIAAMPGRRA